ncbi:hypothetical protein F5B20DRAFT_541961 [Whalleya microplaca]|nr:hypothetical protein F5B20DRAFT_541961 [Whalleya microplaca]
MSGLFKRSGNTHKPAVGESHKTQKCAFCKKHIIYQHTCAIILECGCVYHPDCLKERFQQALTTKRYTPARCSNHQVVIEVDAETKEAMGDETAQDYTKKQIEYWNSDPRVGCDPLYCHDPDCRALILRSGNPYAELCPNPGCGKLTCIWCGEANHKGNCWQDPNDRAFQEAIEENGSHRCWKCRFVYELRGCCNIVKYVSSIMTYLPL